MKKHVILVVLILFTCVAYGQVIKGKVNDADGKPLPFVNVLLLNSKDSTLVKGAVSDTTGFYAIDNIQFGSYVISATMVGYMQKYLPHVSITEEDIEEVVPPLILFDDAKQLGEVVVTEKRPFVEQYIDRMVVNVANSIISSGSTALEVLEKAPGVTVDRQNGSLQLRGKEGVIVQMDGKQTYLSMSDLVTLLNTMPSDNIDKIELITNPSAKYDAAGNSGIINIVLKKNNNLGTNGSVSLGIGSGRYDRERGSFQLNHRTKAVNFFGNYSASRGGSYFDLKVIKAIDNGEQQNLIDQSTYIRFRDRGQNAKAGMDFFLSKNTTVGLVWTGSWANNGEEGTAESFFQNEKTGELYLMAETDKTISTISSNQVANINFQHSFGEKNGQLSADFDFGNFTREYSNTLRTEIASVNEPTQPAQGLVIQMPTIIKIRTVKADYNRPIFSNWKMESGVKTSYVYSDNDMTLKQGDEGDLVKDDSLSNHFKYTERVNAGYASFSGKLGSKTQVQIGVRSEHTHSEGNSINQNEVVTRDYINFFPSFFLTQPLSKTHTLTFAYSYRIDRPNYQSLNPSRSYVDPYLYSRGNPFLKPQYTHSIELKHGFKDKLFTSVGASFVNDLVFFVIQPVDSIRTERTPLNIGNSQSLNLTVSYPITVMKGWSLQTNFLGTYSQFQYDFQGTPISVQQVSGQFNASNTFVFSHGWTAELSGWIRTPSVYALANIDWTGTMDIGIQKSFRSNFLVKLSMQDVFHTNNFRATFDAPNFKSTGHLSFDTRVVMVNFTYSFGNKQLKAARQRKIGSEDETQRTK